MVISGGVPTHQAFFCRQVSARCICHSKTRHEACRRKLQRAGLEELIHTRFSARQGVYPRRHPEVFVFGQNIAIILLNNGATTCDMKTSSVFARIKFLWTQTHVFWLLKELFWLSALWAFARKNIAIFWLEGDTKTQGGVWGLHVRKEDALQVGTPPCILEPTDTCNFSSGS